MIVLPFTAQTPSFNPRLSAIYDGNTGYVTAYDREQEQVVVSSPFEWGIRGADQSLLTRINTGSALITDSRGIEVTYLAGSCAPGDRYKGDTPETAALANQLRPKGGVHQLHTIMRCRHAVLTYAVRFPVGFDWRGGGKLPGLASRLWDASGGNTAVGGVTSFTARNMWRPNGQLTPYFYMGDNQAARWENSHYSNPDMPNVNWGSAAFSGSTLFCDKVFFTPGQFDVIQEEVWLNDVGAMNGGARVSLNGRVFAERKDLIWRWNESLYIDSFFNSSFFGGNTQVEGDGSIWFTPTEQQVRFSDFWIQKIA